MSGMPGDVSNFLAMSSNDVECAGRRGEGADVGVYSTVSDNEGCLGMSRHAWECMRMSVDAEGAPASFGVPKKVQGCEGRLNECLEMCRNASGRVGWARNV